MTVQAVESTASAELDERRAFARGLRELADVLEVREEVPLPYSVELNVFGLSTEAFGRAVRALPGRLDKRTWGEGSGSYMEVSRKFGPIKYALNASRAEVCTPRVVGTEKVEVEEVVRPAVTEKRTVERDVIQWECEPVLGRTGDDKAAR